MIATRVLTVVVFSNLKHCRIWTRIKKFWNRSGVVVWKSESGHLWPEVDKKWSLHSAEAYSTCFFADADYKEFVCRRSGGGGLFFLIFFAQLKLMIASIFCKVSWRIRFADTAFSFSMVTSLFLHYVLLNVCKI